MEAFFRSVAIGLGVLMGTLSPGVEPELRPAVHKQEAQLWTSGTVVRALGPSMDQALDEGVALALTLEAWVDDRPAPAQTRVLAYQPLKRQWSVTVGDTVRTFGIREAAVEAWVSWHEVAVGELPTGAFTVTIKVGLSFPGRPEWSPDLVWKTPTVVWTRSYSRASEVPF